MNWVVYNITGPMLSSGFWLIVLFELIGIIVEAGIAVFFYRLWREKMTSLRLVGIVALANVASLMLGYAILTTAFGRL